MIKRILVIASCVALLVCSFALPASAAVLDSNDYISNISVDGNYDVVTLKFPKSGVWYGSHTEFYPDEFVICLDSPALNVFYTPLRHTDSHDDFLSRSDFPDDTEFVIRFSCHSQNVPESGYINIMQFDSDMNVLDDPIDRIPITVESVSYLDNSWVTIRSGLINWHDDCSYFMINYGFTVNGVASSAGGSSDVVYWYILQDADFSFTFKIESLVRQQQITNKQNAILNAVEKQLADQGKTLGEVLGAQQETNEKLDGIINDKVDSIPPSGGGAVGDLDDLEGGLRDDSQAGLDQGLAIQQSTLGIFLQYATAFAVAGDIFGVFAGIPFFSFLLYVSVALGVFGLLLNLGVDVSLAASHAAKRDRQATNRRVIRQSRRK